MASIEQLKGLISEKGGVASQNVFRVLLPSFNNIPTNELNLLCTSVNIPGKQILTNDRVIGMERQKMPYGYASEDVNMSFYLLNDYGVRAYFEAWQDAIFAASSDDEPNYEMNYKDEYAKPVRIQQLKKGFSLPIYSTELPIPNLPLNLNRFLPKFGPLDLARGQFDLDFITSADVVYDVQLEDAFPTTMNIVELRNDLDGVLQLNVQLSYTRWFTRSIKGATPGKDFLKFGIGTGLSRIGQLF